MRATSAPSSAARQSQVAPSDGLEKAGSENPVGSVPADAAAGRASASAARAMSNVRPDRRAPDRSRAPRAYGKTMPSAPEPPDTEAVERLLRASRPEADPEFVDRLEARLLGAPAAAPAPRTRRWP